MRFSVGYVNSIHLPDSAFSPQHQLPRKRPKNSYQHPNCKSGALQPSLKTSQREIRRQCCRHPYAETHRGRGQAGNARGAGNPLPVCGLGRPCEERILEKEFNNLKKNAGLPNVVFHSLRHSSTTYKLKLNHGDLKATQGDTGHAEIDMITKVYAHILDEDRKINAQKFECAFYAKPDLHNSRPPQPEPQAANIDLAALVEQLLRSPELARTLAALLASQNPR